MHGRRTNGAPVRTETIYHVTHMTTTKRTLDLTTRTLLRLSEIERIIRHNRIIVPTPSRSTLIEMCEDGTFRTAKRRNARSPYLVYEDSFLRWVESLTEEEGDQAF